MDMAPQQAFSGLFQARLGGYANTPSAPRFRPRPGGARRAERRLEVALQLQPIGPLRDLLL